MEIKIIEKSKNKLKFELVGEDHTFSNLLKDALKSIKHVEIATYSVDHPLISNPEFLIQTDGEDPIKCLNDAAKSMQKTLSEMQKDAEKIKA